MVVIEIIVHPCADEEIRGDSIPFCRIIAQPLNRLNGCRSGIQLCFHISREIVTVQILLIEEEIEIPLDHVSSVCELLVHRLVRDRRPALIVFTVTDVVNITLVPAHTLAIDNGEPTIAVHVVNALTILLLLQTSRDVLVADQLVDNRLEHYLEVLRQQELLLVGLDANLVMMIEEGKAQFPQPKRKIRKILALDLPQSNPSRTRKEVPKLHICHRSESGIFQRLESELLSDVLKDRVIDAKQFIVEINLAPLIDGINIDRCLSGPKYGRLRDRPSPINLVQSAMTISERREDEVAVFLLKIEQGQDDVQERMTLLECAASHERHKTTIDRTTLLFVVLILAVVQLNGAINPYGEFAYELTVFGLEEIFAVVILDVRIYNLLRSIARKRDLRSVGRITVFDEDTFLVFATSRLDIFQEDSRQKQHTILALGIVEIPDILERHGLVRVGRNAFPKIVLDEL